MAFETNEQRRKDIAALRPYLETAADGAILDWLTIQKETGVDTRDGQEGRRLVTLVLDRIGRPYLSLPGTGVEMSSAENGLSIVEKKSRGLVNSLKRARETSERVTGRHLEQMTTVDRQKLVHHNAVYATLALSTSLSQRAPQLAGGRKDSK
jgi:hypothetical protein